MYLLSYASEQLITVLEWEDILIKVQTNAKNIKSLKYATVSQMKLR